MNQFVKRALVVIGVIFIVCGLIGGIYLFSKIDFHDYKLHKTVYDDLPTNNFAKLEYEQARNTMAVSVGLSIATIFSGLTTGILFLSIHVIITLLENKATENSSQVISEK